MWEQIIFRSGKGDTWVHFIKQSYWEVDLRGTVGTYEMLFAGLLQKKRRDKSQCYKIGRSASPCCSCVAAVGRPVFACVVPNVYCQCSAQPSLGPSGCLLWSPWGFPHWCVPWCSPLLLSMSSLLLSLFNKPFNKVLRKNKSPLQLILLFASTRLLSRRAKCPKFLAPANITFEMMEPA